MSAGAELGISFVKVDPDGNRLTRVEREPRQGLGGPIISVSGGVGTPTAPVFSKVPAWAVGDLAPRITGPNNGVYSVIAYAPPFIGMESDFEVSTTDQATPTPATATATLTAVAAVPANLIRLKSLYTADATIDPEEWTLVMNVRHYFTVSLNQYAEWWVYVHATSRKVALQHLYNPPNTRTREKPTWDYVITDPTAPEAELCKAFRHSSACQSHGFQGVFWSHTKKYLPTFTPAA